MNNVGNKKHHFLFKYVFFLFSSWLKHLQHLLLGQRYVKRIHRALILETRWCFAWELFPSVNTEPVIPLPSAVVLAAFSRFFQPQLGYALLKQFHTASSKSPSLSSRSPSPHSLNFHAWFFTLIAYAYCMGGRWRQVASRGRPPALLRSAL